MSIQAINWAFETITAEDMTPSVAFTLVALAHCHNQTTRRCDPSLEFLCAKTGLSERAVRLALRDLERRRLLLTTHRKQTRMGGAWNRTNAYTLNMAALSAGGVGQRVPLNRGGALSAGGWGTQCPQ